MKKIVGIILIIILVLIGIKFIGKQESHKSVEKSKSYYNEKLDNSQKNDLNKVVKNVKVTYNEKFKVKGVRSVDGIKATYLRDVDGDTIMAKVNNKEEKVRFLMMDTPETVKKGTPVEPYGPQAKEFVKSKLSEGEQILLVTGRDEQDKYGRFLAYVYYKEGGEWYNLNEELVANGLARVAYVYDKKDKLLNLMYSAEESAQEQKLNIWSIPNYVTNKGYNLNAVS
ncbi:MAG: thermonuclease family protein [Clostridium sp.]